MRTVRKLNVISLQSTSNRCFASCLMALLLALSFATGSAQAESNTTNTISGVISNWPGTWYVGSNGAFNALIVTNAGSLYSSNGVIGNTSVSTNNTAWVTGSGSLWNITNDLTVGNSGAYNQLIVTNGGRVAFKGGTVGLSGGGQ